MKMCITKYVETKQYYRTDKDRFSINVKDLVPALFRYHTNSKVKLS
jgi:hypothetical protein